MLILANSMLVSVFPWISSCCRIICKLSSSSSHWLGPVKLEILPRFLDECNRPWLSMWAAGSRCPNDPRVALERRVDPKTRPSPRNLIAGRKLGRQAQTNPTLTSTRDQIKTELRVYVTSSEARSRFAMMLSRMMETMETKQPSRNIPASKIRWTIGACNCQT